ncbi:MAG: ACT domain-containing protein [bacterium]
MQKTIITVVGKDAVGIIARVCTYLANNKINILDISQTIVGGYFNMMMIADTSEANKTTEEIRHELHQIGQEIGVEIHAQHEGIFEMMHRI